MQHCVILCRAPLHPLAVTGDTANFEVVTMTMVVAVTMAVAVAVLLNLQRYQRKLAMHNLRKNKEEDKVSYKEMMAAACQGNLAEKDIKKKK